MPIPVNAQPVEMNEQMVKIGCFLYFSGFIQH